MDALRERIREAINITSAEGGSDTPDFILAEYLTDCLAAFDKAVVARRKWYEEADALLSAPVFRVVADNKAEVLKNEGG